MKKNKKKSILMIGGSKSRFGGVAVSVQNYLMNIDFDEYDVDLLSPNSDAFKFVEKNFQGKVSAFNLNQGRDSISEKIMYIRKLYKFVKSKQYDIVFVHSGQISFQCINMFALKIAGIPRRVAFSHSTGIKGRFLKSIIQNFLRKFVSSLATDRIGVTMEASKWLFSDKIIRNRNFKVFPNTIDTARFEFSNKKRLELRNELGFKDKDIVVGSIGRFSPEKNQLFLINVFRKVISKNQNVKLLLIGDGPQKDELNKVVQENNMQESIKLLPSTAKANEYYSVYDLFLFPSKFEGFGITVLEAFSNGLSILSSNMVPKTLPATKELKYLSLSQSNWVEQVCADLVDYEFNFSERNFISKKNIEKLNKDGFNSKENSVTLLDYLE